MLLCEGLHHLFLEFCKGAIQRFSTLCHNHQGLLLFCFCRALLVFHLANPSSVNTLGSAAAADADYVEEYRIISAGVSRPFLNVNEKYSGIQGLDDGDSIARI